MAIGVYQNAERHAVFLEKVREARKLASREQRKIENGEEDAHPELARRRWDELRQHALAAVEAGCPDMQIAACLIEALLRTEGFAGLKRGWQLTRGLIENSWDSLSPRPEDENADEAQIVSERVYPLGQLNGVGESTGVLIPHFRFVPLTQGRNGESLNFIDRLQESPRRFKQAVDDTPPEFYQALRDSIVGCQEEFAQLCDILEKKCCVDAEGYSLAPPSSAIKSALDECLETVQQVAGKKLNAAAATQASAASDADPQGSNNMGPIHDREQSFTVLLSVADYFERAEPQSLIPAQLRRIVKLGRMAPAEYFSQLLESEDARQQLFKIAGVDTPSSEETRSDSSED